MLIFAAHSQDILSKFVDNHLVKNSPKQKKLTDGMDNADPLMTTLSVLFLDMYIIQILISYIYMYITWLLLLSVFDEFRIYKCPPVEGDRNFKMCKAKWGERTQI